MTLLDDHVRREVGRARERRAQARVANDQRVVSAARYIAMRKQARRETALLHFLVTVGCVGVFVVGGLLYLEWFVK